MKIIKCGKTRKSPNKSGNIKGNIVELPMDIFKPFSWSFSAHQPPSRSIPPSHHLPSSRRPNRPSVSLPQGTHSPASLWGSRTSHSRGPSSRARRTAKWRSNLQRWVDGACPNRPWKSANIFGHVREMWGKYIGKNHGFTSWFHTFRRLFWRCYSRHPCKETNISLTRARLQHCPKIWHTPKVNILNPLVIKHGLLESLL